MYEVSGRNHVLGGSLGRSFTPNYLVVNGLKMVENGV